jgi:bacillithiol biosynthesis deacetylase BshB1
MSASVLAIGAHPDDAELSYGATIARLTALGERVTIVDLTAGERASRGDRETREREAAEAARLLGAGRVCAGLPDQGLVGEDLEQRRTLVEIIREHRPRIILAPHPAEGHPDHRAASQLVELAAEEARFWRSAAAGERHVVDQLFFAWPAAGADQSGGAGGGGEMGGGVIVDVGGFLPHKLDALRAHGSQFAAGEGPETRLASSGFLDLVEARARVAGAAIGVKYGEGFLWRGALALTPWLAVWIGSGQRETGSKD